MPAAPWDINQQEGDPGNVQTLPELARALNLLRGARSYSELDRASRPHGLARSTLSSLLHGVCTPTRETLVTFLAACGLDERAQGAWLMAWERVATADLRRPPGAVRVREARPRLLGVHASIQVEPAATDLPVYVPRDLDADLRTAITATADRGGLVVLVGGSSVGKTRTLFEAVQTVLPEWWLIHPNPTDSQALRTLAAQPTPRTVVWLDELQRYLDARVGLPIATVRTLVTAGTVLLATLWPDEYVRRSSLRAPGRPDPYGNDRDVLGLGHIINVPDALSTNERRRGEVLAAADKRIRIALDDPDAGFTQVLAAGPELIRWWETAPTPYGKAIITAGLDARRVGATAPLTQTLLEAAAPGYLTADQRATAPADWAEQALVYATTLQHGSAATFIHVPAGMGQVAGYAVADYLHQHARRVRRTVPLPDGVWQALVDHHHPDDALRLADSATLRGRPHTALAFYRSAIRRDDWGAVYQAIGVLTQEGQIDDALTLLRVCTKAGDKWAAIMLANLLAEQNRLHELGERADTGDPWAAAVLTSLQHGQNSDDLNAVSDADVSRAVIQLIATVLSLGGSDGVRQLLELGNEEPEASIKRQRVADDASARQLVNQLVDQGQVDELRTRANSGDAYAAHELVLLLAKQQRIDELEAEMNVGTRGAAERLHAIRRRP